MKIPFRHTGKRERGAPPRFPVWKDERLFGIVSLRFAILVAGLAFMAFVGIVAWDAIRVSNLTHNTQELAQDNKKALDKIKELQAVRHKQRLEDQHRTDIEIRNIACTAVSLFPKGSIGGELLRNNFKAIGIHCPRLGKPFIPTPIPVIFTPPRSTPPDDASSPVTSPSPRSSPSATPGPKSTVTERVTPPVKTKTVIQTTTPAPKPIVSILPCATLLVIKVNCK